MDKATRIPTYKSILLMLQINDLNGKCRRYSELPTLAYLIHKKFPQLFADATFEEISGTIDSLDLERALRLLEYNGYIRIVWQEEPLPGSYISLNKEAESKISGLLRDIPQELKSNLEAYISEIESEIEKNKNWIKETHESFRSEQKQFLQRILPGLT